MEEEYIPVNIEIGGVHRTFEYGKTECHVYRYGVDQVFNHIQAIEHDTQRVYIFNVPKEIMFLSGQEVPPHDYTKKEIKDLTSVMDHTFHWEADFILKDRCPEHIKERYIRVATVVLRLADRLYIPKEW